MKKFTQQFLRDNKGVTAIEYGLIAGLIVLVIAASVTSVGTNMSALFTTIANKVSAANTSASS
jgi:pilus assembly protein Flp/PilA